MRDSFFAPKKLYYRLNDISPGKPSVVFIHGLSSSSSAWIEYEKKFMDTCNILSVDLRGHGKSWRPHEYEEYAVHKFADDINALLDHVQIQNPILISHSYGTMVALDFLVRHEARVKAAVFLSPSFKIRKTGAALLFHRFLQLVIQSKILPSSPKTGGRVDYSPYKNTGDLNPRRLFADIKNTGLRPYVYAIEQSYHVDHLESLSTIKTPVLIMHGKKDTIFPVENAIIMAEKIKNSRLILLEDANHVLVLNNVEEVQKAIDDFVNKNRD